MDDAAAPAAWDALRALIKRLGPYDEVRLEWAGEDGVGDNAPGAVIPLLTPGGHPVGRLRLLGGPPPEAPLIADVQGLARHVWHHEQEAALLRLLGRHVVHDLRTPVTIIQGYGDLLRSGKLTLAAGSAPLQAIVDQTARLLAILHDFALASGTQVPGRHLSAGADVTAALKGLDDAAVAAGLPLVAIDAALLTDIVQRLLALARTMSGASATLTVSGRAAGEAVLVSVVNREPLPMRPVAQAVLAGILPRGAAARLPWLMRLLALQRLVDSQGGRLDVLAAGEGTVWQCGLPLHETAPAIAGADG